MKRSQFNNRQFSQLCVLLSLIVGSCVTERKRKSSGGPDKVALSDTPTSTDSGGSDAASPNDAGPAPSDAASTSDTGPAPNDAASPNDAGPAPNDAASPNDAGPAPSDAASPNDAGPAPSDSSAPSDISEPVGPCGNQSLDGDETDVDCGGSCPPCTKGKKCKVDGDCTTNDCLDGLCTGFPNPCWEVACPAEFQACLAVPSCVAWNDCQGKPEDEIQACFAAVAEADPTNINPDSGNHVLYYALQECGWNNCNDPNAGSCAEPGKNGAINRCGQWDDAWPCNCDDACEKYNDCCADKGAVCMP